MSAARVLFDAPGPVGRRRIAVWTVVISVLIAVALALAVWQFASSGELAYGKWKPFWQQWAVAFMARGLVGTLQVTAVAALFAFPVGALLAVGRAGRQPVIRYLCTGYIEVFRSVPTLLLVYMFLFALPGIGLNLSTFWKLVVPIVLINAAVIAEIVRAGINALDRGQREAALALGLTTGATMRLVLLPQAIRLVVPSLVTQLVALLKDSTLGYVVSFPELMRQANNLAANTHLLLQAFVVVALVYIVINFGLTRLATWLEGRLGRRTGARVGPAGTNEAVNEDLPTAVAR